MANNVFKLPFQQEMPSQPRPEVVIHAQEALAPVTRIESHPEYRGEPFRRDLDRRDRIWSYREIAQEAYHDKNRGFLKLMWSRTDMTDTDIIDNIEQHLAYSVVNPRTGKLEATSKRFWLGSKGEIRSGERGLDDKDVAHYYFQDKQYLPDFSIRETTIHYEVRPDSITKWVNGIPYFLTMDEIKNFEDVTSVYEDRVCEKLSPVDSNLHDLQEEMEEEQEEEKIFAAQGEYAAFSQAAIDRMRAQNEARIAAEEAHLRIELEEAERNNFAA